MGTLSLLLLFLACGPHNGAALEAAPRPPQVRHRPVEPPDELARLLVESVPGGQWDAGLAAATSELLSLAAGRTAHLDPDTTSLVTARAGYPGQARYARALNGGALPLELVDRIARQAAGHDLTDLALAKREYGDGVVMWVLGWAPHLAEVDPLPRDIPLDEPVALHVDLPDADRARLFVAPPDRPVEELSLTDGVKRWMDVFHTPGAYRVEVVADRGGRGEVVLLFSLFVDSPPPEPGMLRAATSEAPDPIAGEAWLYEAVNRLRVERGLAPVTRLPVYEGVAREHSALMASADMVAHTIPGLTEGVPARAALVAHPKALHHETVAAARSAEEALAVAVDSPGHLATLLCKPCSHVSIGAALEPVLDRPPRLFVTFELLELPQGVPQALQQWNKP